MSRILVKFLLENDSRASEARIMQFSLISFRVLLASDIHARYLAVAPLVNY